MNDIRNSIQKSLIDPLSDLLKNGMIVGRKFGKPKHPACIFYFGENSAAYQEEMSSDLTLGWGEAASYIKHYKVLSFDDDMDSVSDFNGNKVTKEVLLTQLDSMMQAADVFSEMHYIHIYCILKTSEMKKEEFEKWYLFITKINSAIPSTISVRSALMVIFDQSLNNTSSNEIREKLLELYESPEMTGENTHAYSSVFLLSNRLRSGAVIPLDPKSPRYKDYNLYADIILLTDTDDNDFQLRISSLYGSRVPAFTAAYRNRSKPKEDITMITLKRCLEYIRKALDSASTVTVTDRMIGEILGARAGSLDYINNFYDRHIESKVSDFDALKYLPSAASCENMTYGEANEATQGCLDLFVDENYYAAAERIVDENSVDIVKALKDYMLGRMTVEQKRAFGQYTGNIENIIQEQLITKSAVDERTKGLANIISLNIRRRVNKHFVPLISKALQEIRDDSAGSVRIFENLYHAINSMTVSHGTGLTVNINSFYENIVDNYYIDMTKVEAVTTTIISECHSEEDVLKALRDEMNMIFGTANVFRMSFIDELKARAASVHEIINIGELVTSELTNSLETEAALSSSNIFSDRFFEAYFVTTDEAAAVGETTIVGALRGRAAALPGITVTFYNTSSIDKAESIWFYKCSTDNVRR